MVRACYPQSHYHKQIQKAGMEKMMITRLVNSKVNARLKKHRIFVPGLKPQITVVVPVFDQQEVIFKHLESILQCMRLPFEFLVINDSSTDKTHKEIARFIDECDTNFGSCVSLRYYKTIWPWFETRCDDFAIRESSGLYIIEIQADMLIMEDGFDVVLHELMQNDDSIFALSARGTHELNAVLLALRHRKGTELSDGLFRFKFFTKVYFKLRKEVLKIQNAPEKGSNKTSPQNYVERLPASENTIFPSKKIFTLNGRAGFLGDKIDLLPYETKGEINKAIEKNSKKVWFGETIMRGPIIIEKNAYILAGGFDIKSFYQGYDDHDLSQRVKLTGKRVGFTPISFASPLILGSGRKKMKFKSKIWSKIHRKIRLRAYHGSHLVKMANKLGF